jgi:hypothetical protein
MLDLTRLRTLAPNLDKQVLMSVIEGERPVPIDIGGSPNLFDAERQTTDELEVEGSGRAQRSTNDQRLLEQMLIRIMRHGGLAKRETGVHSVWLGYPLVHVSQGEGESVQQLLAPIFLWPVLIESDRRRQGRYLVRLNSEAGRPQFNQAMASWIRNRLQLDLFIPSEDELQDLTWETLRNHLNTLVSGFQPPSIFDLEEALLPIPGLAPLRAQRNPRLLNCGAVGYFRWQNEAILADLETIRDMSECQGPVVGFVSGAPLEKPAEEAVAPPESDRFLVCDADFSQERAIWKARSAPGVVIHGPPGTGKSQTIVNIIADALAHDKTVLMVCQKQAATRVVLERLRRVALDKLCVEVHDPESDRVSVFNEIRDQVSRLPDSAPQGTTQQRRTRLADQIRRLTHEMDRIASGLHERSSRIGLSYREIKAREGRVYREFPTVRPIPALQAIISGMSAAEIEQGCIDIQSIGQRFKEGDALNNPWRFHRADVQDDPMTQQDVSKRLSGLISLNTEHVQCVESSGAGWALPSDIEAFAEVAPQLVERLHALALPTEPTRRELTLRWIEFLRANGAHQLKLHRQNCAEAVALSAQLADSRVDPIWERHCSNLTGQELEQLRAHAECVEQNRDAWWLWRWLNGYDEAYSAIKRARAEGPQTTIGEDIKTFAEYLVVHKRREQLRRLSVELVPGHRPAHDSSAHSNYAVLASESLEGASWFCEQERKFRILAPVLDMLLSRRELQSPVSELIEFEQCVARARIASSLAKELAGLATWLSQEPIDEARAAVLAGSSIEPWLMALSSGFPGLRALLRLEIDREKSQDPVRSILAALEEYEQRRTSDMNLPQPPTELAPGDYGRWWRALVESTANSLWIKTCQREYPELLQFSPEQYEQQRQQLRVLREEKRGLEAQSIRERWLAQQKTVRDRPWNRIFQLRGQKAQRLRQAVYLGVDHGLLKLRPCWLVDPGTAAQIFPLRPGLFDLVIFDEASQCPIEYALPAICRGKNLIVSGDAKQLPPTSFFTSKPKTGGDSEEDETDEDNDATDEEVSTEDHQARQINMQFLCDVEDLLEASNNNLPGDRLLVHYRSDHPALIEFSNRAFYHGALESPPPRMNFSNDNPPIQFHSVNGVYADRTNRDEARKVLKILRDILCAGGPCPTIGVVTFNGPQRDLIEDLLERECQSDELFANRFGQEVNRKEDNQDVGFFVKNLENVQGDERDTMIFSTTFGLNSERRFYRKFGPVGHPGGERRLNVAITRAKHQVIVVSSIPIEEVSTALSSLQAPGIGLTPACYLQLYLAYAKAISDGDQERVKRILDRLSQSQAVLTVGDSAESPLEEEVFRALQRLGCNVDCQVGESGFRIDLAVLHSIPGNGYALGIECDGATYHSDRAAHLRDVWREKILRDRGWRIHRIWSTRWWYHRAEEIQKLTQALAEARLQAESTMRATAGIAKGEAGSPSEVSTLGEQPDLTAASSPLASAAAIPNRTGDVKQASLPVGAACSDAGITFVHELLAVLDAEIHPAKIGTEPTSSRRDRLECWREALNGCSTIDATPEGVYAALAKCDKAIASGREGPRVRRAIQAWFARKSR